MAEEDSPPSLTLSASRRRRSASTPPLHSPSPVTISSPLKQHRPDEIRGEQPAASEVGGDSYAAGEVDGEPNASGEVGGEMEASGPGEVSAKPHASGKMGEESSKACGEPQVTRDVRVKKQVTIEDRLKQPNDIEVPRSLPSSKKRSNSEAGNLRAWRAVKVNNSKGIVNQLQDKSKTIRRKMPPIVSGSPMINLMARKRTQSWT